MPASSKKQNILSKLVWSRDILALPTGAVIPFTGARPHPGHIDGIPPQMNAASAGIENRERAMKVWRRQFISLSMAAVSVMSVGLVSRRREAWGQGAAIGRISRVSGSVTIQRGAGTLPATADAPVETTDHIRTGADSRAEIVFSDNSVMTVGPESEVAIASFAPAAEEPNAILDLLSGIVRVTVNAATDWGRFEVRTATAVASVRGTDYLVELSDKGSAVFVAEGRVAVSSRVGAGTVIIREGQGVDVTAEYKPLVVKTWGAKRRDAALARVTFP